LYDQLYSVSFYFHENITDYSITKIKTLSFISMSKQRYKKFFQRSKRAIYKNDEIIHYKLDVIITTCCFCIICSSYAFIFHVY